MRYLLIFLIFCVGLALCTGCFETRPPVGITGEILGCIEENDRVYCVLEYPAQPVSLDAIVEDAASNSIEYEKWVVSITGEVNVGTLGIWLETGNDDVGFSVLYAPRVWTLETGKRYKMTVFIDAIDRDRGEYDILAYPVKSNILDADAVEVNTITDAVIDDVNAYDYTAINVKGVVSSVSDSSVRLSETTDAVSFSVTVDNPADYEVDTEYTFPVYIRSVHTSGDSKYIFADLIEAYGAE